MSDENKVESPMPVQAQEELVKILKELSDRRTREHVKPVYGNSFHFEMSEFDLKMTFGQLTSQFTGKPVVDWHTSVTMPWAQAKLLSYYLRINLALHESNNGKIKIPANLLPPPPPPPPDLETNAIAREIFEFVQAIQRELVAEKSKTP
jgi:hypothetical protein